MSRIKWLDKLGWSHEQLDEMRIIGYAYLRQGKYDIALTFFEALAALDNNSAYDMQTLGALYLELNRPQEALKSFDKALKIEADHSPTLLNVTKSLFMLGKTKEALKLAAILSHDKNRFISNNAKALLLAYSE